MTQTTDDARVLLSMPWDALADAMGEMDEAAVLGQWLEIQRRRLARGPVVPRPVTGAQKR